jgi:hypothetical protein
VVDGELDADGEGEGEADGEGELEGKGDGEGEGQAAASPMTVISRSLLSAPNGLSQVPAAVKQPAGLALLQ